MRDSSPLLQEQNTLLLCSNPVSMKGSQQGVSLALGHTKSFGVFRRRIQRINTDNVGISYFAALRVVGSVRQQKGHGLQLVIAGGQCLTWVPAAGQYHKVMCWNGDVRTRHEPRVTQKHIHQQQQVQWNVKWAYESKIMAKLSFISFRFQCSGLLGLRELRGTYGT